MLVLSRKPKERIIIDNQTCVTVLEIRGGRVKLGIEAPPEVPVHRNEIVEWTGSFTDRKLDP
jgi:carbon storage regulator